MTQYVGHYGMGDCLTRGEIFETKARRIFEREGYETQKATPEEDYYKGIDFWAVGSDGKRYSFNAKSMKRKSRSSKLQDEWTFVEWLNWGHPGWITRGCDILVFERRYEILAVRRTCLLDFCNRKTDFEKCVQNADQSEYCLYSRPGRRDVISMFKFNDLDVPYITYMK